MFIARLKKLYQNANGPAIWSKIKPWLTTIVVFLGLQYTGFFSGISQAAQAALMKTGVMDAKPVRPAVVKAFDYNFTLKDLDGNTVDVSDFKNKTLFINLWATWCGPCRAEMPSIQSLYTTMDPNKVAFIMLSLDDPDHDHKVKKYITDHQFTFPVFRPVDGLHSQLQVSSIPTTFIVSPGGKIVSKRVGAASYDNADFQEYLKNIK